jgi:hypothetical protein
VKESAKNWGSSERSREEGAPLAAGWVGIGGGSRAATEEEEEGSSPSVGSAAAGRWSYSTAGRSVAPLVGFGGGGEEEEEPTTSTCGRRAGAFLGAGDGDGRP